MRKTWRIIVGDTPGSVFIWQEWYFRWMQTNQAFEDALADDSDTATVRSRGSVDNSVSH